MNKPNIKSKFKEYRQSLLNAMTIEKNISLINTYSLHLELLAKIEIAFNNNDTALLTNLIEQESRSYGWSFLPNNYGEKVEIEFWNLKKTIMDND